MSRRELVLPRCCWRGATREERKRTRKSKRKKERKNEGGGEGRKRERVWIREKRRRK